MEEDRCPFCAGQIVPTMQRCPHCGEGLADRAPRGKPTIEGTSPGAILLLLVAFAGAGLGVLFLSQATTGVGFIGGACFLAICARIVQASAHHKAVLHELSRRERRLNSSI